MNSNEKKNVDGYETPDDERHDDEKEVVKIVPKKSSIYEHKITIDDLNNTLSTIYINTLKTQDDFIKKKLLKLKNRFINDAVGLSGTKEVIAKHLNQGLAQNLVQNFFKTEQKCLLCSKSKPDVKQLERAHCNNYSRYDLLLLAVEELYDDENTPIKSGDILKLFIQKHELCPIYTLCKKCHGIYDN
jgi:molybdopterin converting factor small subunit